MKASLPHLAWMAHRVSVFLSGGREDLETAATAAAPTGSGERGTGRDCEGGRKGVAAKERELIDLSALANALFPRTTESAAAAIASSPVC